MTAPSTIPNLVLDDNGVCIEWPNEKISYFHFIWLRDNCRCELCGDPATGRRNLRLTDLDLDQRIDSMDWAMHEQDPLLKVQWANGHQSSYSKTWLQRNAYDEGSRRAYRFVPKTWRQDWYQSSGNGLPRFEFDDIIASEGTWLDALHSLRDYGICFVKGSPPESGILESLALKIGFPQESNFGRIQDLVIDNSKLSVANRAVGLKPHTDEPYRGSPPGILMFHCIETDITGAGQSLFMDGFHLAQQLREHDPEGFEALCQYRHSFRRHFAGDVDLIAQFPLISLDEFGAVCGLRINDRVAAPLSIPTEVMAVYYRGLKHLLRLCEDENQMVKLSLSPGDIALFDNHRILHGRTPLSLKTRRWLQWVQIERGDFHSTLRILADDLDVPRDESPLLRGSY